MLRRSFLFVGTAALTNSLAPIWSRALAQSSATSEADRIAEALTPRRRRGGGGQDTDPNSIAVVDRLKAVRQRRGLNLQEQDELFDATKAMPQVDLEVYFAFGSVEVSAAALPKLDVLGKALSREEFKANTFVISGHTDRKGTPQYNQTVSDRRAQAVARYLAETHKIALDRMLATGYGFRKLKLPNQPFADENRRVQIVNAAR